MQMDQLGFVVVAGKQAFPVDCWEYLYKIGARGEYIEA